jgi:hypothetical protein
MPTGQQFWSGLYRMMYETNRLLEMTCASVSRLQPSQSDLEIGQQQNPLNSISNDRVVSIIPHFDVPKVINRHRETRIRIRQRHLRSRCSSEPKLIQRGRNAETFIRKSRDNHVPQVIHRNLQAALETLHQRPGDGAFAGRWCSHDQEDRVHLFKSWLEIPAQVLTARVRPIPRKT